MKTQFKITFAEIEQTSAEETTQIVELINSVYDVAEKGMWKSGKTRINKEELKELITANEIVIAKKGNDIVGSICIYKVSDIILEFRMLTSTPQYRGAGIGSQLVDFVEKWATDNGYTEMQLIVIKPSGYIMKSKTFLVDWYIRLGYQLLVSKKAAAVIPELEKAQEVDCDFDIYRKPLA